MARGGARQGAGRKRSNTDLDIIKLHLAVERIQRLRGRNCSRRDALRQLKEEARSRNYMMTCAGDIISSGTSRQSTYRN